MESIFTSKRRQSLFPADFRFPVLKPDPSPILNHRHVTNNTCCINALDTFCTIPCSKSLCPHPIYSQKIMQDRKIYQYLYFVG